MMVSSIVIICLFSSILSGVLCNQNFVAFMMPVVGRLVYRSLMSSVKLLDCKPMGTRPVGRPRQCWQEDVMEDLKKLKVKNWKDRRTWRDLAEKMKTHKGL